MGDAVQSYALLLTTDYLSTFRVLPLADESAS